MGAKKYADGISIGDIEDLIHNFLIIMLEHSMRQKDGWKASYFSFVEHPMQKIFSAVAIPTFLSYLCL
jgi:hypothetical protein